jgi:hypothetical protein
MDNAGDKILNPQVVMAKPIPKIGDVKKGQVEFELLLGDDTIEKSFGYPVKLPYNIDGFAHKVKDGWKITEKRSGLQVGFSSTKEKAIQEAKSRIEKQSPERMESSISVAEKRKIKAKNSFDSIESFYDLDNNEKLNVLKEIYKNSNISDNEMQDILDKDWDKDLLGAITETYIDNDFSFNKFKKSDIIKQDNTEVKEDGNINSTTEDRATGDVQGDVLDTTGRNEQNGIQQANEIKSTIEDSNQDIATDDAGLGPINETGNEPATSKRDNNSQLYSGNVKQLTNDSFTLNQDRLYDSGEVSRFTSNIKAIKLIKENKTFYTDEEKQIISSYTGFGGLQKAFKDSKDNWVDGWQQRGEELKLLLTADEYKAVERGILDAFYTPLPTIKTMWDISSKLGFKGGLVLEPSIGTGRFIGMTPDNLKLKTSFNGIEIDPITYKVAKALYSKVNLRNRGFEATNYDSNHDMVIGNPPYGKGSIKKN